MGQVTIYLDAAAERRVKAAARKSRVSVSRWTHRSVQTHKAIDAPPARSN
jgi:hypothetical protein